MVQVLIASIKAFFRPTKNKLIFSAVYFILFLIWISVTANFGPIVPSFLVSFIFPLKGIGVLLQELPFQLQFGNSILGIPNAFLMSCILFFLVEEVVKIKFFLKTYKLPKPFLFLLFLVCLSLLARIFFQNLHPVDKQWGLWGLSLLYFPVLLFCLTYLGWKARMKLVVVSSLSYLFILVVLSLSAIAISGAFGSVGDINVEMFWLSLILPSASVFLGIALSKEYRIIGTAALWFGLLNFINDVAFTVYYYDFFPRIMKLVITAINYPQVYTSVLLIVLLFRIWSSSFETNNDEVIAN